MTDKRTYAVTTKGHQVLRHIDICIVPLDKSCPDCGWPSTHPHRCPGVKR